MRSILKPKVEEMVFLRMRSDKIMKNGKMPLKRSLRPNSDVYNVCRHGKSELEVDFETRSRSNGVSTHAQ